MQDWDWEVWQRHVHDKDKRWVFNKLEVALRQGLHAGPAGTPPLKEGVYVVRPVYNVFGMGISAKKVYYTLSQYDSYVSHGAVEPGNFWCEWLSGPNYSVDYVFGDDFRWKTDSVTVGEHFDDSNLTKFRTWTKLSPEQAPEISDLPLELPLEGLKELNVEMRDGKIIEAHFRLGHRRFADLPVGTVISPIWDNDTFEGSELMLEEDPAMRKHMEASGNVSNVRQGYIIQRP